ncbi:uncharacterized protein LOC116590074 [Mustela erminea]|uniref:uncharacterized protein LOC116590074 n=1 Tax=Mustela erminea TaxID=36723 RepID=UPI0013871F4A|nr:uncharacterized protein LOC116590074 [Mustela erminea]
MPPPPPPPWLTLLIEQGSPGWQEKPEQDGSGAERGLLADGAKKTFHRQASRLFCPPRPWHTRQDGELAGDEKGLLGDPRTGVLLEGRMKKLCEPPGSLRPPKLHGLEELLQRREFLQSQGSLCSGTRAPVCVVRLRNEFPTLKRWFEVSHGHTRHLEVQKHCTEREKPSKNGRVLSECTGIVVPGFSKLSYGDGYENSGAPWGHWSQRGRKNTLGDGWEHPLS